MSAFWLYRAGINAFLLGLHHVIFSETWLTTTAPISTVNTRLGLLACSNRLNSVFGAFSFEPGLWTGNFWEQLWPRPELHESTIPVQPFFPNLAAPEASFRLQRVGASGKFGGIRLPIIDDRSFTDRPHRRRVDVATLAPLMAINLGAQPMSVTSGGRTYQNVIFNRKLMTWDNVVSYQLLESTCRVWQRAKIFDPARISRARAYVPPEPDNAYAGK